MECGGSEAAGAGAGCRSLVVGRWSSVAGRRSSVAGCRSSVVGRAEWSVRSGRVERPAGARLFRCAVVTTGGPFPHIGVAVARPAGGQSAQEALTKRPGLGGGPSPRRVGARRRRPSRVWCPAGVGSPRCAVVTTGGPFPHSGVRPSSRPGSKSAQEALTADASAGEAAARPARPPPPHPTGQPTGPLLAPKAPGYAPTNTSRNTAAPECSRSRVAVSSTR